MGSKPIGRKGQIGWFILIGITLVILTMSYLYIQQMSVERNIEREIEVPLEVQPVNTLITDCLEQSLKRGLYLSAIRGGRIYDSKYIFETDTNEIISIFLHFKDIVIPTKNQVESELLRFVEYDTKECIMNDTLFYSNNLEFGPLAGSIVFKDDKTELEAQWDISVSIGEKLFKLNNFFVTSKTRYKKLYDLAYDLILNQMGKSISSFPVITDPHITAHVFPYDENIIIYTFTDKFSELPLVLMFATMKTINSPPHLETIPDFVLSQGKPFYYEVEASDPDNDELIFSTDSNKVSIDPLTGEIEFTPDFAGKLTVNIGVEDYLGNKDEQKVIFRIDPILPSDRMIVDKYVALTIPVMSRYQYEFPAISLTGEKLSCEIDVPLFRFIRGCTLIVEPYYNLVELGFDTVVTIKDESGYETTSNLHLQFVDSPLFTINPIGRLTAKKGEAFSYQVKVDRYEEEPFKSQTLYFSDNSPLFDISSTGLISFVPRQAGTFAAEIEVSDALGNTKKEEFELVVNE